MNHAEEAFAAGQLDEAFDIAIADDLSEHPRIQRLRKDLARAFLERGQEHLLSRRFDHALADFDRAARCGHQTRKVEQWQRRAREAMQADARRQHDQAEALDEARQRIGSGSLAGAADALARAPAEDSAHAAVSEDIERQAQRAAAALEAARVALQQGRIRAAAEKLQMARQMHNRLEGLADTEHQLVARVVQSAREHFRNGRLDRVAHDLEALGEVGRQRPDRIEVEQAVELARDAARALGEDDYAEADVLLGRLEKVSPKTGWLAEARKRLRVLEENRRALLEGPLGLLPGGEVPARDRPPSAEADTRSAPPAPEGAPPVAAGKPPVARRVEAERVPGLPRRLLLRIDGVGSFLLIRGDRIAIGRAGPGSTADLPLVSDLSERQAEIVRAGEDYFVVAQTGVELAGRQVDHALLQDGDRIRLSKRIRLKFRRPSLKSTAAVLELGDGVRTTTDCRRAILWSGPVLMGGTRECHVPLRDPASAAGGGFVLLERGGRLYVKPMGPHGGLTPVILGDQMELGELRFSVAAWPDPSATGRGMG